MLRVEDMPGAGRSLPSTGGDHPTNGVGDDRTDVRVRPHCMGGGRRLCRSLLLPGPAQPPPPPCPPILTCLFQPIVGKRGYSDVGRGSL